MIKTTIFNIGGKKYEVDRALLDKYPNSMLALTTSDLLHNDDDKNIFIDRDRERFRLCLDYMRDGKVYLPMTANKKSLIADMEYYGIAVDDNCIQEDDSDAFAALAINSCGNALTNLEEQKIAALSCKQIAEKNLMYCQFVENCYMYYMSQKLRNKSKEMRYRYDIKGQFEHDMREYYHSKSLHCLFFQVGLKLCNIGSDGNHHYVII
eukprot:CAMPEP_0194275892 /NCGR_PEP_ID=MMETSP0169-20130528/8610_1 /TAXON_ID=218684 /ORGANISM="Corethron pennatum, Strain L29A3" /LENGTH=207 /DNA_ID=CAMNT_0039019465 /DNA_START=210 /DNA_END=830 /DNA_ORIENTATION=-